MRRFDEQDQQAWMDDRVEAFVDGSLAAAEAARFEALLADDADWEAEVFLAGRIRDGLQVQPLPACPPALTQAVLAEARRLERRAWGPRLRAWCAEALGRWWALYWQPTFAMATLVTLVCAATLLGRLPGAPPAPTAAADVEAALAEAKWTLAYLSEVGRQTGRSVRHDVLEPRVVGPMQQALGTVFLETQRTQN